MVRSHVKVAARRLCQCSLIIAIVRAWDAPFKGVTADLLLESIPMYLKEGRRLHANIVNSSGTGKSRMVDEVAKKIITVPMCLRENGDRGFTLLFPLFLLRAYDLIILIGFPPPDTPPAWLYLFDCAQIRPLASCQKTSRTGQSLVFHFCRPSQASRGYRIR
jgi:hypothetical protein